MAAIDTDLTKRPYPPAHMLVVDAAPWFEPAPDVLAWLRDSFINPDGPACNPDHQHLQEARLGVLWTNTYCGRNQREVVGMAEVPRVQGHMWLKARNEWMMGQWFGDDLDFLLTFSAPHARGCSDAEFCALVEHELYHCAQMLDDFGMPKFTKDGAPKFGIMGHDVEEFVGVVRRYGAITAPIRELVEMASREPEVAPADLRHVCGTCLRLAA